MPGSKYVELGLKCLCFKARIKTYFFLKSGLLTKTITSEPLKELKKGLEKELKKGVQTPVLVVLNKLVKTFEEKSNLKCGLIRTRQLH
jgi:hypothetical protein